MSWLNSIGLFGAFHCWIYLGKGKAKCWYYPQWGLCWNAFNVNLSWIFARPDICLMHQGWCRCKNSKSLICIVLLHFLLVLHVILGLLGSISTSCVICILMLLLLTVLLLPLTVFALFLWTNSFTVIIGETLTIVYIKLMTNIRLSVFCIAESASHRVSLGCYHIFALSTRPLCTSHSAHQIKSAQAAFGWSEHFGNLRIIFWLT